MNTSGPCFFRILDSSSLNVISNIQCILSDNQKEKAAAERAAERKSLVSTGDRSAKIRTYNFPQGRVTDHRINFTSYRLSEIMNGDIEEIIENLKIAEQQDILSAEIN